MSMVGKNSYQLSFASRQEKFRNAVLLIESWNDYNAASDLISKPALNKFILEVQLKNNAVTKEKIPLDNARAERKTLCFFNKKLNNSHCFENRLLQIAGYVASAFGIKSVHHKRVHNMLKKFRPNLYKPKPTRKGKKVKHKLRRSFNAMTGFADETVSLISELINNGFDWQPHDTNISLEAMTNLAVSFHKLNNRISLLDDAYKNAVIERKNIYKSMNGRIRMIKNYLSCFPKEKQSDHFIEFVRAVQ